MTELTGQEVVSEIAKRLRGRFSEEEFVAIYKDKPVQSMNTPCIFIHSVETEDTPELRDYSWWNHIIDIRCHLGRMQLDVHSKCRTLGPAIAKCVKYLTISGQQVKSRNAIWRVEDNVIHVIVSYRYRVVIKSEEAPDMQTITYGKRIKE